MVKEQEKHRPVGEHSGYLVASCDWNRFSACGLTYRGLERMPEAFHKMYEGETDPELLGIVSAAEDTHGFIKSHADAREIVRRFSAREDVEILFCRSVEGDGNAYSERCGTVPAGAELLGFDVSDFEDFSAIWNGLLGNVREALEEHFQTLNQHALFTKAETARSFRQAYLTTPHCEKDIDLRVWEVWFTA